jgi:hypothetical protein
LIDFGQCGLDTLHDGIGEGVFAAFVALQHRQLLDDDDAGPVKLERHVRMAVLHLPAAAMASHRFFL